MDRRLTRRQVLIGSAAAGAALFLGGSAFVLRQQIEDEGGPQPSATPGSASQRQSIPTPSPEPDAHATPAPDVEASPPPSPELSPGATSVPDSAPEVSIQQLVDEADEWSTVTVPAGVYREHVTIWKPLTLIGEPGAEIRGDDEDGNLVRERWIVGEADDVTIEGFAMRYAANPVQSGAITNNGYDNWVIRDCVLSHASGANVSLASGSNLSLVGCEISDATQLGVHGTGAFDVTIENCWIHNNHSGGIEATWEAGGLKFTETIGLIVTGCDVHDNDGPGLWADIDCHDTEFSHNRVHHNTSYGINNEVSGGCRIFGNAVYENGHDYSVWAMGAGILVQNGSYTEIFDNVVAWNADGISVVSQDRSSDWPEWNYPSSNQVHNNVICLTTPSAYDNFGLAWTEDWEGGIADSHRNNRGWENRYYHASPPGTNPPFVYGDRGFEWDNLEGFSQTDGEDNAQYLSDQEKDEILSGAGIPVHPESRE